MKKLFTILAIILISKFIYSQSVNNITATLSGTKIKLSYKISGMKYYQSIARVDFYVSMNGERFKGPLKMIAGETGKDKGNGTYTVTWDVLKEIPFTNEVLEFDIRIKTAEKDRSPKFFACLTGNDVTPVGIKIGMLGKTAWYVEARGSLLAMNTPSYTYNGNSITDYNKPGYYEYSGTAGWQSYSVVAGVTQQLHWNIFMYAGVGYGVENYVMEINEYDYSSPSSTSSDWAKYDGYCTSGIEIDAGLLYRYKKLIIGAGATSLDFSSFGWSASLGIQF